MMFQKFISSYGKKGAEEKQIKMQNMTTSLMLQNTRKYLEGDTPMDCYHLPLCKTICVYILYIPVDFSIIQTVLLLVLFNSEASG